MSEHILSESLEYERYVDELRRENAELLVAVNLAKRELEAWYSGANTRKGLKSLNDARIGACFGGLYAVNRALSRFGYKLASALRKKAITVKVEGGMVSDVGGIPAGYELRVEDYDHADESHPGWDAEKECFATVYGGDGV